MPASGHVSKVEEDWLVKQFNLWMKSNLKYETQMNPKSENQLFKEWLSTAIAKELKQELLHLSETDLSISFQIDRYELKIKSEPPSQEDQAWRFRAGCSRRWVHHQRKAIEHRVEPLKIESKAENTRLNAESARLKQERIEAQAKCGNRAWIAAAKSILDPEVIARISTAAKESLESADRQPEKQ